MKFIKALIFRPAVFILTFLPGFDNPKAQTLPSRFSQVLVANGISDPTVMAFAPDGRIFVAQQTGQLRIIKNGALLAEPFISLPVNSSGERGLLGIAFDPNFTTNKYIYLYYTLASAANNRISRFTANGDRVVAGSERVILELDPLSEASNHNGGTMQFGPDGKLYVGVGDNADAVNAQIFDTYHGKILRISPDGSVPPGNPFTTGSAQQKRVWAYGLRNPFTIAFQPGTGKLFVNDVGGSTWEEINDATAKGQNFGWPYFEGSGSNYSNPLYEYGHGSSIGTGCAITGGSFFNPSSTNYPTAYFGKYFFLDYCSNWIDMLTLSGGVVTRSNFASNIAGSPVSLVTGTDGNLYFLSRDNSAVYKISYSGSSAPVITNQPQSLTVAQGNAATFSVSVTGGLPFSYQWRKDSTDISGATSFSYTIPSVSAASAGTYSVVVKNAFGTVTSKNAALAITSANKPPVATITTPVNGTTYAGGNVISFSGTATDPENGALPASAYRWFVTFHHGTHTHPGPSGVTGAASGSFTIPASGETATDVFYRLYLIVTDQLGAKDTAYKDIRPRTSNITLYTSPQGLNITLDGQPYKTPLTITSVEGIIRTIGTTTPQVFNGLTYKFGSWSQGGVQTQKIFTPVNNVVYTAKFNTIPVITKQPQQLIVIQGKTAKFTVAATGTAPLSYQWRKNGVSISGATSSSYTLAPVAVANAGNYSVVASNAAGSAISNNVTLTVIIPPVITKQPQSLTVIQGKTVKFTVTATGTAPLSYQWRKNGVSVSGATSSSYTLAPAAGANAGNYSVVISNAAGKAISNNATLTVITPPAITKQPASLTVSQGKAATFTVTSSGSTPFNYQWRKNGIAISGATSSSYAIASVTTTHAANYSVVIKNAAGTVISNDAKLTVIPPPVITKQPQNVIVAQGNAAIFTVTATGTTPLRFQWRKDGANISEATGSSYKITAATVANEGTYSVAVSNTGGTVVSNNAMLTVISAPVITAQPQSITVAQEDTATFTVTASGTAPLSYQWRKNGININNATSSTYSIPSIDVANAGTYSVVVSNAKGSVTSHNATLTVTTEEILYTIFQPAAGPATPINNDGQGIELGVRFRSTENGFITGIRYYKGTGTTGTHIGHLWSNTGTLLGAATFTNETASGWQQVFFSSPVAITAGVTYVASQFSPAGDYPSSLNYFTQPVVNGPLRALADGEDGINGVYNYSTIPVFPTSGNLSSNYWVDVVFTPIGGSGSKGITTQTPTTQQQQLLKTNLPGNSVDRFVIKEPDVNVIPNPSNSFFNLVIKGNDKNLVTVRVFDISGRLIEKHEKIASSGTLQFGHKWIGGSYFVEVIQGNQRKFIKIIKVN